MKVVYWIVGIVVAVPLLFLGIIYGASELGGEVVTLARANADDEVSAVRVWIVDEGGSTWIEHGDADAFWIKKLSDDPEVLLTRDGRPQTFLGVPDPGAHDQYHRLRQAKYGWADGVVAAMGGGGPSDCLGVPVRLQTARSGT